MVILIKAEGVVFGCYSQTKWLPCNSGLPKVHPHTPVNVLCFLLPTDTHGQRPLLSVEQKQAANREFFMCIFIVECSEVRHSFRLINSQNRQAPDRHSTQKRIP